MPAVLASVIEQIQAAQATIIGLGSADQVTAEGILMLVITATVAVIGFTIFLRLFGGWIGDVTRFAVKAAMVMVVGSIGVVLVVMLIRMVG
jgi:hypothetical protein